jgi:hydrogenase/urease accessory protein HupE
LSGLDHIIAMVAVGLYAANLGGRNLWLVPSAFIATMIFGGALSRCRRACRSVTSAITIDDDQDQL